MMPKVFAVEGKRAVGVVGEDLTCSKPLMEGDVFTIDMGCELSDGI